MTPRFTVGSLFAGIGGIDLGFERTGFTTKWQVEIDPYCQRVLAKNFPHAERYADVRGCGAHNLSRVDVIVGGFPCTDISNAGKRAGITGPQSGLWSEYARIIRELRPSFVFVENVAALLGRGMGRVLGDLAEIGYDAEWEIVSARDVGAPHLRERVWILAYPNGSNGSAESWPQQAERAALAHSGRETDVAYPSRELRYRSGSITEQAGYTQPSDCGGKGNVENSNSRNAECRSRSGTDYGVKQAGERSDAHTCRSGQDVPNASSEHGREGRTWRSACCSEDRKGERSQALVVAQGERCGEEGRLRYNTPTQRLTGSGEGFRAGQHWATEPNVCGVAHGLPAGLDEGLTHASSNWSNGEWAGVPRIAMQIPDRAKRLRGLGNAVVPQIPELFARRIHTALIERVRCSQATDEDSCVTYTKEGISA